MTWLIFEVMKTMIWIKLIVFGLLCISLGIQIAYYCRKNK